MLFGDKQGFAEIYLELRGRKDKMPPASLRIKQQGNALPEQAKTQDRRKKTLPMDSEQRNSGQICKFIGNRERERENILYYTLETTLCITLESRFTCKKQQTHQASADT
jgi:hypothetical protein